MSFNHLASNCMKSLLIICSKLAKVTSKQCSGAISTSLSDKAFQSYSFVIHWLLFVYLKPDSYISKKNCFVLLQPLKIMKNVFFHLKICFRPKDI